MSRLKESLGGRCGGRASFLDASPRRRCPVCGSDSWCQLSRDGETVLCKHVSSGRTRTNRDGIEFFVHHLHGRTPRAFVALPTPTAELANIEQRDGVYRAFLSMLSLLDVHHSALLRRGLRSEHIASGMYRSLPLEGRARIVRALLERAGALEGIPGFHLAEQDGRSWWTCSGAPGLIVPARDLEGRIAALKLRRDEASEGPRYLYFSSAKHDGPSAENALHFPAFASRANGAAVRITEGELKSDVATALSSIATLSVPGVGSWRKALPALDALKPSRVLVAFDSDARSNPHVARAQLDLVRAVRDLGFAVELERWPGEHKGIDDFLAARARAEVNP